MSNEVNINVSDETLKRILKLLALSKDKTTTEAEAAAAAGKAADMMAKHNISIGVLTDRTKQKVDEKKSGIDGMTVAMWQIRLAHAAAIMMDCGCFYQKTRYRVQSPKSGVWRTDTRDTVYFYGLPQNIEGTDMVYNYLEAAGLALFAGAVKTHRVKAVDKRGYMNGIVARLSAAISEFKDSRNKLAAGESLALVKLSNQLLTDYANKRDLVAKKANKKMAVNGWYEGYADGARVDIHGAQSSRMLD